MYIYIYIHICINIYIYIYIYIYVQLGKQFGGASRGADGDPQVTNPATQS